MTHIGEPTLAFLADLARHNERAWFNANKARFEAARRDVEIFVDQLIAEIAAFDPAVAGLSGKDCVFRIYRDTRFSKDKTPYKAHFGGHIVAGGRKGDHGRAGYYVHIQPGESFLAGGAHQPPAAWLGDIRRNIETDAASLKKIVAAKPFKTYFGDIAGEKLKTAPRGYAKDHPEIELLRYKSLIAVHDLTDKQVTDTGFLRHAATVFKALAPFDAFLNRGR
jgi:uncharacterized protein (TIGR02453 family)